MNQKYQASFFFFFGFYIFLNAYYESKKCLPRSYLVLNLQMFRDLVLYPSLVTYPEEDSHMVWTPPP